MKKGLYYRDGKSYYLVSRGEEEEKRVSVIWQASWFGNPPHHTEKVVKSSLLIPWGLLQIPGGYE